VQAPQTQQVQAQVQAPADAASAAEYAIFERFGLLGGSVDLALHWMEL